MILLLSSQVLLSLTLLVSGLAKLPDRTATADAMVSLRLPAPRLHRAAATALPVAEIVLALAVWILVPWLQTVLAVGVLLLMLAYLAIIGRALTFDEPVTCSCFGTLGSPTVTGTTLARNVLLSGLAVLAVASAASGTTALALRTQPLPLLSLVLSLVIAAVLAGLTLGVSRRAEAAGEGAAAASAPDRAADPAAADEMLDYERSATPFGMLRTAGQEPITLSTLTRNKAALLIWLQPGCGPCERVLSAVPGWVDRIGGVVTVRTLFRMPPEELPESVRERAGDTAAHDIDRNLMQVFQARHSPAAVLLGADGMLAGGPVRGGNDVVRFVEEIIEQLDEARETGELPVA